MALDDLRIPAHAVASVDPTPAVTALLRERELERLVQERGLLRGLPTLPTELTVIGDCHWSLSDALAANGPEDVDGGWLALREHLALRALTACPPAAQRTIRFRSHEWSNELLAQADQTGDEDLAALAEALCVDSRIVLAGAAGEDLPPECRLLGELLYTVYRHGGWACGWRGRFADGRLQVYVRHVRP